jgi:hypothetical protein
VANCHVGHRPDPVTRPPSKPNSGLRRARIVVRSSKEVVTLMAHCDVGVGTSRSRSPGRCLRRGSWRGKPKEGALGVPVGSRCSPLPGADLRLGARHATPSRPRRSCAASRGLSTSNPNILGLLMGQSPYSVATTAAPLDPFSAHSPADDLVEQAESDRRVRHGTGRFGVSWCLATITRQFFKLQAAEIARDRRLVRPDAVGMASAREQ